LEVFLKLQIDLEIFVGNGVVVDGRNAKKTVGFQPKTPEMPDYRIGT